MRKKLITIYKGRSSVDSQSQFQAEPERMVASVSKRWHVFFEWFGGFNLHHVERSSHVGTTIYFNNLDGLRFLCFLSVFFYHSFDTPFDYIRESSIHQFIRHTIFLNSNLGVNFFFVLSGFLITYLLITEKQTKSQISLGRFWIRRILRIWPLFYLAVFFGFFIFPALKSLFGQIPSESASILYYLTFLNNFDVLKNGQPDASILGALWSVAVEEQFYMLWPVILYLLPVRKYWIVFVGAILISCVFAGIYNSPIILHYHTLSCMGDMAIGALGAWAISQHETFKSAIVNLKKRQLVLIYVVFFALYFFRKDLVDVAPFVRIVERSLIAFVMLLIILEQCYAKQSFLKLSRFKTLSHLGTISYGLYCFHFIGILMAKTITHALGMNTQLWQVLFLDTILALLITIFISRLSFIYFETPFLKLKERFSAFQKQPIVPTGGALVDKKVA